MRGQGLERYPPLACSYTYEQAVLIILMGDRALGPEYFVRFFLAAELMRGECTGLTAGMCKGDPVSNIGAWQPDVFCKNV